MTILSWLLSLSTLVILMIEAVDLHRSTVCRQEAWLLGTELLTHDRLTITKETENRWHANCKLEVVKKDGLISWNRLPKEHTHAFDIQIKGKL